MTHILNRNLPSKTILLPNYIYTKCSCLFQSNHRKRNKTPLKMQFSQFVITFQHALLTQNEGVQLQRPDKTTIIVFPLLLLIIALYRHYTFYLESGKTVSFVLLGFFIQQFPPFQRKAIGFLGEMVSQLASTFK